MKTLKTFILMAVMTFILMLIGNAVAGREGLIFALIMAGVMGFVFNGSAPFIDWVPDHE